MKICCNNNDYISLKIRNAPQIYIVKNEKNIEPDSYITVKTERGKEVAKVYPSCSNKASSMGGEEDFLKKVYGPLDEKENELFEEHQKKEKEALEIFRKKVIKHDLPMKVIEVYYMLDNSRIMFYYYAENKVDFRKLVRELAGIYKTRIEMRQVGIRDEAKIRGGLGPCGLITCCKRFLYDFESISMKMAKDQEIMLNPSKISGICGRLMCCLKYEQNFYSDAKELLPEIGTLVKYKGQNGRVINTNAMKKSYNVKFDKSVISFTPEFIKKHEANIEIVEDDVIDTGGNNRE